MISLKLVNTLNLGKVYMPPGDFGCAMDFAHGDLLNDARKILEFYISGYKIDFTHVIG